MNDYTETPLMFGPDDGLFGMFSQPQAGRSDVACLVLNTGVNHRIGPHRINVKTARRLASAGIPTLRFDLSGIGDSVAAQSRHAFRAQAVEDMKAAMDCLAERHGIRRFLVFGICSGAENAMAVALGDPRIVGMLAFDGEMYLTRGVRLERKLRRLAAFPFNAAVRASYFWWRDMTDWLGAGDAGARTRTLARLAALRPNRRPVEQGSIFGSAEAPVVDAAEHERRLLSLADRGVAVSLMYSVTYNSVDRNHGMLSQLRGSRLFERVQYRFWPDVDHTATTRAMQTKLLDAVADWASTAAFGTTDRPARPGAPAPVSIPAALTPGAIRPLVNKASATV
jgi:pimeloyl-ACP methyl ester carboxylesterase